MLVTALLEIINHILYNNDVQRYMWLVAIIWVTSLNPVGQWIIQANICGLFATLVRRYGTTTAFASLLDCFINLPMSS